MHRQVIAFSEEKSFVLNTDKDGKVKLGPLRKMLGIKANVNLFAIEKNWILNHETENLTYPAQVDAIENETLEFPVLSKKLTRKNIQLIKKHDSIVLEDLFDSIEFVPLENCDFNKIKLKNLADGTYMLYFKKIMKTITITIHKGTYWENDSFILKRNCLFENRAALKMVKFS